MAEIKIDNYTLELLTEDHVEPFFETITRNRTHIGRWSDQFNNIKNQDDLLVFINSYIKKNIKNELWAWILMDHNHMIGLQTIKKIGLGTYSIGYVVSKERTGQRLAKKMTEATMPIFKSSVKECRVYEIYTDKANVASMYVPKELDFKFVSETNYEMDSIASSGTLSCWRKAA